MNKESIFGKKMLNLFKRNRIKTTAILITQPKGFYARQFKSVRKRIGLFQTIYLGFRRQFYAFASSLIREWKGKKFIHEHRKLAKVYETNDTNSIETIRLLKKLKPDMLIMGGGAGIVKEDVIKTSKHVLNCHPGVLPDYRGFDVEKWAILNNEFDKLGCTLHHVDKGVDTGRIIKIAYYQINPFETLRSLYNGLEDLTINTLVESVIEFTGKGRIPKGIKQEQGTQYYIMDFWNEKTVKSKLKKYCKKIPICLFETTGI